MGVRSHFDAAAAARAPPHGAEGRAVRVEPMKPVLKQPGSWYYALETEI